MRAGLRGPAGGRPSPLFFDVLELRADTFTMACRLHRKGRGSSLERAVTPKAAW